MLPETTICVLCYGDHTELARKTIESIRHNFDRGRYRLRIGANAVCDETNAYLEELRAAGEIDLLDISETNINKCPMMRRLFASVETEFIWWFDDDSYVVKPDALSRRLEIARSAPPETVMWGHVFFFGNERDFSYATDVVGFVRRAPWYRGQEPPSWEPGGKGEQDFQGKGTGDGRWFFATGGCWFIRTRAVRDLDWPDPRLIKRGDDVFLAEAIRQQGWRCKDIGPCGVAISTAPRRGDGEDAKTMRKQVGVTQPETPDLQG